MMKILVTSEFCNCAQKLVSDNKFNDVHSIRTALILLANRNITNGIPAPLPKKFRDHELKGSDYRELHISGDTLLIYRYEFDYIVVTLKLTNIIKHNAIPRDTHRNDYVYKEVSTTDLHDITSAVNIFNDSDIDGLYDLLESISDYASVNLKYGYILLYDYYLEGNILHCLYDYVSCETDKVLNSIDYMIDLDDFVVDDISELDSYMYQFADEIYKYFE